ncbi:MAG TPA: metallophosphoesterase family protein [Blastocatellia bacterium]|nr:metallophosphoesterase family protein [Blastocatellia bacterium]
MKKPKTLVGIISDTHGLLRPEAVKALSGSDLILHAGDIGKPEILKSLKAIAPVRAIRGNNDTDDWAKPLGDEKVVKIGALSIYMIHNLKEMKINPSDKGYDVVVSGHSHKPYVEERDGVLFVNPGSAGPRRFKLPISVALLTITGSKCSAKLIDLI